MSVFECDFRCSTNYARTLDGFTVFRKSTTISTAGFISIWTLIVFLHVLPLYTLKIDLKRINQDVSTSDFT